MSWLGRLFGGGKDGAADSKKQKLMLAHTRGFKFEIVGESNYQKALSRFAGGTAKDFQRIETVAEIQCEPDNPYDSNAVVVKIGGQTVGYLARGDTNDFRKELSLLDPNMPTCVAKAKIVGGWKNEHSEGSFGVKLNIKRPLARKKTQRADK